MTLKYQNQELHRLDSQVMDLQGQIVEQSALSAKMKMRERMREEDLANLRERLVSYESNPPPSPFNNSTSSATNDTSSLDNSQNGGGGGGGGYREMEYLRNILYEYMLGKETKTLSKVICSVVHFSGEQTKRIEEREELRNSGLFSTIIPTLPHFLGLSSYPDENSLRLKLAATSTKRNKQTSKLRSESHTHASHSKPALTHKPTTSGSNRNQSKQRSDVRYSKLPSASAAEADDIDQLCDVDTSAALPPSVLDPSSAHYGFGSSSAPLPASSTTPVAKARPIRRKKTETSMLKHDVAPRPVYL